MRNSAPTIAVVVSALLAGCVAPQPQPEPRTKVRPAPQVQRRMQQPPPQQTGQAVFKGETGKPFQLQAVPDEDKPVNTFTSGTLTLKDKNTGEMQADPQIRIVERWGAVNALQGITFECSPTNGLVSFPNVKSKIPTFAKLEFQPPDRWKTLDSNFFFLNEMVQTRALTTQSILGKGPPPVGVTINDERSITRASIVQLPQGEHILFGYKFDVSAPSGQVTFRLGKIIAHENCRVMAGE